MLQQKPNVSDVMVIGAGPAGVLAAIRAADLGARTQLVTSTVFGGMATNEGPVPVRTLAHAARLIRQVPRFVQYGVTVSEPVLDYPRLLERVHEVVADVVAHSSLREPIDSLGVTVHERTGPARFCDPRTVITANGLRLQADKIIICAGGVARRLAVPGFHLTMTPGEAWRLTSVPASMLVIGGGATGAQVASIFRAFGTQVQLFEPGPRILSGDDADVSAAITAAFRQAGMLVHERFGKIESFEKTPTGVRMNFSTEGRRDSAEATFAVVAAGWVADTAGLNLAAAGVAPDQRGFVQVDEYLQTSMSHIFAAGDITGRIMLVPPAMHQGFVAASNAVLGPTMPLVDQVRTGASLTDPEYASAGLTEAKARETHDVLTTIVRFDSTMRTIIDGRKTGFCKLIVDRKTAEILGCHVVGERAGEIVQVAAIAIAARMRVDELAHVPLAFPTYTGNIAYAAADAARQLDLDVSWRASSVRSPSESPARRAMHTDSHANRPTGVTHIHPDRQQPSPHEFRFTQETIGMTTQTAEKTVNLDKKSGKGLRDRAISEGAFFFDVKPGHEQELRAAVQHWADFLRKSPVEETLKTGLRDSRHIIFDGGKRLVWMTTFENDWDPYVEDALVVVGLGNFIDWIQHTKQIDAFEVWMREAGGREVLIGAKGIYRVDAAREKAVRASAAGLKALLQAAQTPAAGYFNAVSYLTHPQIIKSWQVNQAFQQVLDDPSANEAFRNPALKPLLEQAVD